MTKASRTNKLNEWRSKVLFWQSKDVSFPNPLRIGIFTTAETGAIVVIVSRIEYWIVSYCCLSYTSQTRYSYIVGVISRPLQIKHRQSPTVTPAKKEI